MFEEPSVWQNAKAVLKIGGTNLISSFRYQEFRWYWLGNILAHITFLLQGVVLGWSILVITDSAFWVGMVVFSYGLPMLIISPLAGLLSDRFKRQVIILISLGLATLTSAILGYFAIREALGSVHILLASFVLGSAFATYAPARLAVLPGLVPDNMIFNATTLSYSGTRLMGFFGPVLGGFLLDITGIFNTLVVQTLLFILATLLYYQATISLPEQMSMQTQQSGILRGIWDVTVHLRSEKSLLALMLLGLVFVPIGMPYLKLMPVFVRDVLDAGPQLLGLLVGLASLGAAVSGLAIVAIGDVYRKGYAILISSIAFGIGLILFAFSQNARMALGLIFFIGLFSGVFLTLINVLLLTQSPDNLRGRMVSVWGMVWGLIPLTSLLAGAAAEKWGISRVLTLSGFIVTVVCVLMLTRKSEVLSL